MSTFQQAALVELSSLQETGEDMEVGHAPGVLGEVRGRAEIEYVLHCQTVNKIYLNEYKTLFNLRVHLNL